MIIPNPLPVGDDSPWAVSYTYEPEYVMMLPDNMIAVPGVTYPNHLLRKRLVGSRQWLHVTHADYPDQFVAELEVEEFTVNYRERGPGVVGGTVAESVSWKVVGSDGE